MKKEFKKVSISEVEVSVYVCMCVHVHACMFPCVCEHARVKYM